MSSSETDVIIIGGGVSASVAAYNLSLANLKIACFEQGKYEKNSQNYKHKNLNFNEYKKLNINPNLRKSKFDYPINDKNSDISIANFNGVGGSSVLYSAHLPRFLPEDFENKKFDNIDSKWPISYNELKKYYEKNEKILGIAGLSGDASYPDVIKNLLPPVKLGAAVCKLAVAFEKLGWHWWPSYSGVITKKIDYRKLGTIVEPNNSYWPKALKNNIKLYTETKVLKIISTRNKVTCIEYLDSKKKLNRKYAKIIILACSGIGTPRLLLNSKNKYFPKGLANKSGLVGKNLMLHPLAWIEGKFSKFLGSQHGPQGCSIYSTQFKKNKNFFKGYTIQVLRETHPVENFVMRKKLNQLKFGKNFFKNFFEYFGKTISAAVICEDLPYKSNKILLDYKNLDIDGMPGVKIFYKISKNSKKMILDGINNCTKLMKIAGAKKIISFGPVKHTGWHIMGTAKMGKNKKNSVVDANGKCHDLKNLYIVDPSIFCSSSAMNPVSTICALSLKITDNIKKKLNV